MIEPPGAGRGYSKANHLLVKVFEESLKALEAGERFSEEDVSAVVGNAEDGLRDALLFLNSPS